MKPNHQNLSPEAARLHRAQIRCHKNKLKLSHIFTPNPNQFNKTKENNRRLNRG